MCYTFTVAKSISDLLKALFGIVCVIFGNRYVLPTTQKSRSKKALKITRNRNQTALNSCLLILYIVLGCFVYKYSKKIKYANSFGINI